MLYPLIRRLLFTLQAEQAHEFTLTAARLMPFLGHIGAATNDPKLQIKIGQCNWSFPVGLAAGLDKNAEALSFFENQGFGSLECGTITLKPQLGNLRPRVWRYVEEESLRNAMGFPNRGLESILKNLQSKKVGVPLGANIGKNKDSTPEESIEELTLLFEALRDEVDYFTINVSSPNTPGLRAMQEKSYLTELFDSLNSVRQGKDLYLKIAPDLSDAKIMELTDLSASKKLTGIIATNTTIMEEKGPGGISGKLLSERSKKIRKLILSQQSSLEVIGVGGISHSKDIFDFWKDGGKAVQVYTAYVFQGPELLNTIKQDVLKLLQKNDLKSLSAFFELDLKSRQQLLIQPA